MPVRPLAGSIGLVLAVMLAGCASATPSASPSPSATASGTLQGVTWMAMSIGGTDTLADHRPTMLFDSAGRVQGTGSCNSYGGPYRVDGDTIEIGDLASTMMLCQDQGISTQETAFLAALRGAQTWQIDDAGELHLSGTSEIVARAADPAASGSADATSLVGAWNLAELGRTADFAHLQPTIEFGSDGTVSGFAGCNTFSSSYTTDGATLTFGPMAATKMACQRPGSAVEADYLTALGGVTGWAIEADGRLRLDGTVPLLYTRA